MNVDALKRAIRAEVGVSEDNIHWGASKHWDDGRFSVRFSIGREVTESMIEADFHQTRFEADSEYRAWIDTETESVEEIETL